jgi:uncharacterized protein YxjI
MTTTTTFRIKEKFWFWETDNSIQNDQGKNVYKLSKKSMLSSNITVTDLTATATTSTTTTATATATATTATTTNQEQDLLLIRKPLISLQNDCYHIVRISDNQLIAQVKEKYIWLQAKRVFLFGDLEYLVDDCRWRSHSTFTMKYKGFTIAHVYKKMLDLTGSLWVDIDMDPSSSSSYKGHTLREIHAVVISACMVLIQILNRQVKKAKLQEYRDAVDKMPLQTIKSSSNR